MPSSRSSLAHLDRAQATLADYGGLPQYHERSALWRAILLEDAYHSTGLAGNQLSRRQLQLLLDDGTTAGEGSLADYVDAHAYATAARTVYRRARPEGDAHTPRPLALGDLLDLHASLGLARSSDGSARLRRGQPARASWRGRAPEWRLVLAELAACLGRANGRPRAGQHALEHIGGVHADLMRVRPFAQANGRVARLVTSWLLLRRGYPPAVPRRTDLARYEAALSSAGDGDLTPLVSLLAGRLTDVISNEVLPSISGASGLLPLSALADPELSVTALRKAAERGRLDVTRREGRYFSTRDRVARYKRARYRRRRRTP